MYYYHEETQQLLALEHARTIRLCKKPSNDNQYAIETVFNPSKNNPASVYLTFKTETEQRQEFGKILKLMTEGI